MTEIYQLLGGMKCLKCYEDAQLLGFRFDMYDAARYFSCMKNLSRNLAIICALSSTMVFASENHFTETAKSESKCRPFTKLELRGIAFNAIEKAFNACRKEYRNCFLVDYKPVEANLGTQFNDCSSFPASTSPGSDTAKVIYEATFYGQD